MWWRLDAFVQDKLKKNNTEQQTFHKRRRNNNIFSNKNRENIDIKAIFQYRN